LYVLPLKRFKSAFQVGFRFGLLKDLSLSLFLAQDL